jgi:CRP-like cAMP-binding protein
MLSSIQNQRRMLSLDETKLERRSLARSECLFRQGDKVQAIYFIEEGRLRLDRRTFDGRSLQRVPLEVNRRWGNGPAGQVASR